MSRLFSRGCLGGSLQWNEAPPPSEVAGNLGLSCVTLDGSTLGTRAHSWGLELWLELSSELYCRALAQAGRISRLLTRRY